MSAAMTGAGRSRGGVAAILLLATALGGAGCESVSDATTAVRERMAAREAPKVRTYAAQPRATYDGVRAAATQMGYRMTRGGAAQGEFEAVSAVHRGETHGSSRQLTLRVKLKPTLDAKGTEVAARIGEVLEGDSSNRAGVATETPLRDTPQYDVFFERLAQVLGVAAVDPAKR